MKNSFARYILLTCSLFLSACDRPAPEYVNSGDPERLLDISTETVSFGLDSKKSLARLSKVINQDRPTDAELRCSLANARCTQAKEILERESIPVSLSNEESGVVVLSYNRVAARDCEQHFVDNMSGSRSFNHPAFGCATVGNMVQMVADKNQFSNPNLLDLPDAEKVNQTYGGYLKPSAKREFKEADWESGSK